MKLSVIGNFGFKEKFLLKILENKFFFFSDFFFASENSINKCIIFFNKFYRIIKVEDLFLKNPEFIIFSSDFNSSLFWSPIFSDFGSIVIDNSFAWNMNYNHKSIIQKINNNFLKISDRIISVPNFLITQLIMILIPIFISHKIKKITLFILQPFSNNNSKLFQSINERLGIFNVNNFFYSNTNSIMSNNVNKGENFKNEIKKIFDISDVVFDIRFIESSSLFSNSIFINIEFYEKFILSEIQDIFKNFSGIFIDNNFRNIFNFTCPSLFFSDLIFLQKIKKDTSNINSLNLSVSSNDLRNKPFFNIIQIFEHIYNCSFFI